MYTNYQQQPINSTNPFVSSYGANISTAQSFKSLADTNQGLIEMNAQLQKTNSELVFENSALNLKLIETNNELLLARAQIAQFNQAASAVNVEEKITLIERVVYKPEATLVYGLNKKIVVIALASTVINFAIGMPASLASFSLLPLVTVGIIKVLSDCLRLSEGVQAYARKLQGFSVIAPTLVVGTVGLFLVILDSTIQRRNDAGQAALLLFAKELFASMWIYNSLK